MKSKKVLLFMLFILLLNIVNLKLVNAESINKYINNNNIEMTINEYTNLIRLGFTESEIANMNYSEFENNRALIGKIIASSTKYYKVIESTYLSSTIEITEEEYNKTNLSMPLKSDGYIETTYKKVTTTIISLSNYYRYKINVEWKNMPSKRSYDIIAIGKDSNVSIIGSITFQQNYCYSNGNCYTNSSFIPKTDNYGGAAFFQLPSSSSVSSLSSYMYYTISKNTSNTIYTLNAYGDYAHATSTTYQSYVNNFSVNSLGIILDSSIISKYDEIPIAQATSSVNW